MEYEIVDLADRVVSGVSAKTGNADPMAGEVIGGLWGKFFAEQAGIKDRKSPLPLCLYSDYAATDVSGENLHYEVTIGYETLAGANPEYTEKTIPAGRYAKFTVCGDVSTAVMQAWQKIWATPLERRFSGDFEEYLNDSMDNAEIAIYVALK